MIQIMPLVILCFLYVVRIVPILVDEICLENLTDLVSDCEIFL
jgi:hypothetical protein